MSIIFYQFDVVVKYWSVLLLTNFIIVKNTQRRLTHRGLTSDACGPFY